MFYDPTVPDLVPGEIEPVKITQQQTSHDDEECCAAKFCYDKDLATHAASSSVGGSKVWLKLEFGRVYLVFNVVVYTRFFTNWFDPASWCFEGGAER